VRHDGWRARMMAAVTEHDAAAGVGELVQRLCRFAMQEMALSAQNATVGRLSWRLPWRPVCTPSFLCR
jgi:hypothetical protein